MILDKILLKVNKPAQYLGNEVNVIKKDFDKSYIRFALCFPDFYTVGMSNLGFRIIYGLLNSIEDVTCERVFLPEPDLMEFLEKENIGIFSWELKKRLADFDIIGFSLSYELTYTNILKILDLANIPLYSSQRKDHPLIIAGGPCSINPEPLADFFDLFIIGEAEEAIIKLIDIYRQLKKKNLDKRPDKDECLHNFKYIEGVYIPSFYDVSYHNDGTIKSFSPNTKDVALPIKKLFLKNIENSFYPTKWLVPYIELIHDRLILEIMRGCPNNCRFCQTRSFYYPYRIRSVDKLLELAKEMFMSTGYEELSLGGLSVCDYPYIKELLEALNNEFKEKRLLVSFSSLRHKRLIGELISNFEILKKGGLTFAPETASERLRKIINKDFDVDEFFLVVDKAYPKGFNHIKLYFMIGLPSEKKQDLEGVIEMACCLYDFIKEKYKRTLRINLSINPFVPKPHTPFQWLAMEDLEKIKEKENYLFLKAKPYKWLKISFHNRYMSFLECLLSRADRKISKVIYRAYKKGAIFESLNSQFSFKVWEDIFKEEKIDPNFYVLRNFKKEEIFPWDFIDVGISKELLWQEFQKIVRELGKLGS
jgi:radical SAM family uncharacterized protein